MTLIHHVHTLSDAELQRQIALAERQARHFDAAESPQWFHEMAARDANYCLLMKLREEQADRLGGRVAGWMSERRVKEGAA